MLLPKDFASTMSDAEMDRIIDKANALDERGEKKAANSLRRKIFVNPILTDGMKHVLGLQRMRN